MQKTKIDWPGLTHTWNPITGCKRNCSYCYARRIHERFYKTPFADIVFHPKRLREAKKLTGDEKIFVGSMSDIEYWPREQTQQIIEVCKMACGSTFMFLSKNADSYKGFNWPANTMQGLTITGKERWEKELFEVIEIVGCPRPFISIEPLMGCIVGINIPKKVELIIVGAMTGPGAIKPQPEWIQSVKDNMPADKIYWKNNIKE